MDKQPSLVYKNIAHSATPSLAKPRVCVGPHPIGNQIGNLCEVVFQPNGNPTPMSRTRSERSAGGACQQCQECETKCPQNILISQWMPYIADVLGRGKAYDPAVRF